MIGTLITGILTILGGLGGGTDIVYAQEEVPERKVVMIETIATLRPELEKICACESGDGTIGSARQFKNDGTLIIGIVDNDDRGMCQINRRYHKDTAESMGLDIDTEQGNIKYANYLYETQGSKPWNASKKCWSK